MHAREENSMGEAQLLQKITNIKDGSAQLRAPANPGDEAEAMARRGIDAED